MYQHTIAYRHQNGNVEGFKGFGFTPKSAEADALNQIQLKLSFYVNPPLRLNPDGVITDDTQLTLDELEGVRQDWHSKARYVRFQDKPTLPPYAD